MRYEDRLRDRIYWRVYNGFEIRAGQFFFWLNFMGVGVGKLDHEGLGRGQWVRYWSSSSVTQYPRKPPGTNNRPEGRKQ